MIPLYLLLFLGLHDSKVTHDSGRLSMYAPKDGFNHGELACGGKFTSKQKHIAYRKWWKVGCGRKVIVCSEDTQRCAISHVRDAGPFGIYRGKLRNCVKENRWKVWTKSKPPKGWKWRAVADLSIGLWKQLGKPRSLSKIHLFFLPKEPLRVAGQFH